jgi:hypothetical protein
MKVICTRPNASTLISGVRFEACPSGGMISEEIDEETAAHFLSISGYRDAGEGSPPGVGGSTEYVDLLPLLDLSVAEMRPRLVGLIGEQLDVLEQAERNGKICDSALKEIANARKVK